MRRGLKERAPGDAVNTFLNSKVTTISESSFSNSFLLGLSEFTKGTAEAAGSSPLVFKKNFPIAQGSQSCAATATTPALTGDFNMNVDVDLDGFARYGFAVEGKLVPPAIGDVGFFTYVPSFTLHSLIDWFLSSTITGSASAIFHVVASAQATVDSGRIPVGSIPLAALSFPG